MEASPITPDLDEALRYAGVRADESGDMHRKWRKSPRSA